MNQEQIADATYSRLLRENLSDADPEFAAKVIEATCPIAEMIDSVNSTKFHRIYGKELTVALESTLNPCSGEELDIDRALYGDNKELIFRNGDCWRIYYPARTTGDITQDTEAQITFLPWFSGPEVMYYRLVLRVRPISGRVYRWMAFARFNEKRPFGFDPAKPPFINLDFFSKRNDEFFPLFVKIKTDSELIYFVLEGQKSEEAITLKIRRIAEAEAPLHLVTAKP